MPRGDTSTYPCQGIKGDPAPGGYSAGRRGDYSFCDYFAHRLHSSILLLTHWRKDRIARFRPSTWLWAT